MGGTVSRADIPGGTPAVAGARRLVYGLSRSGLGVLGYLKRHGMMAHFYDNNLTAEDAREAQVLGFQPDPSPRAGAYDQVIAAPGVPINHPQLEALRQGGAEIIGEAELVYRHSNTPLIGITGTAGKTSCTLFTAHFLQALGFKAVVGGNIDPPLASVADDAEVVATELSSFQLERIVHFHPRVAVLLLLGIDHLDRHGTVEAYHAAKLNLIKNLTSSDALVYNAKDSKIVAGIARSPAKPYPFEPADNPRETNLRAAEQAALAYAELMGQTPSRQALHKAWDSAPRPPGRFEVFAQIGQVVFIDDSIATRIDSVRMALEAARAPVAWILGGVDKGAPVEELLEVVGRKVRVILTVGKDGPRMADAFRGSTEVIDLPEAQGRKALEHGVQEALRRLDKGSVLLAPLATSFDQFKDYKERSQVFREVVRQAQKEAGVK